MYNLLKRLIRVIFRLFLFEFGGAVLWLVIIVTIDGDDLILPCLWT